MSEENKDLACFLTVKHSLWKGKYKRIFSIGTTSISTYNPNTMDRTNQWAWGEVIHLGPPSKGVGVTLSNEFTLTIVRKGKKTDTLKFSSEHRAEILTEAMKHRHLFAEKPPDPQSWSVFKHHWSETRLPVVLELNPWCLNQLDPSTRQVLASYPYKDMEALAEVHDCLGGFVIIIGGFARMHMFASNATSTILQKIVETAGLFVGVLLRVRKDPVTLNDFVDQRFGRYSADDHITSISEFTVHKITPRHSDPVRRILCLTETCLLERDPDTYAICTLRPLGDIFSLVRCPSHPQQLSILYVRGEVRTYTSTDRDSLLASLIDGVRASGNRDIHVRMTLTDRGKRLGPYSVHVEEEVETMHLKFLQQQPQGWDLVETLERFNANIAYNGLLHAITQDGLFAENKEKLIVAALTALFHKEGDQINISAQHLEAQFQALRRLVASRTGFAALTFITGFRETVGAKVVKALARCDAAVTYAAMDMVCTLMEPMHDDYDLRQEQLNKSSLLSSKSFLEKLMDMWEYNVSHGTSALVVSAMLDFLTFALCAPYSETTDGKQFEMILEMVAERGRPLFRLFLHPSSAIVKGAGLVMKAVIEEGDSATATRMQELSLAEGALPTHLLRAMFTQSTDGRMLTNRQLSRHLVGLWVTGCPTANGLLHRIMPSGLLIYLKSKEKVPKDDIERLHIRDNLKLAQDHAQRNRRNPHIEAIERQLKHIERHVEMAMKHWRSRMGVERKESMKDRPIVLRKRRQRVRSEDNWDLFYYHFNKDHTKPNLIWNYQTREELREALESEIRGFNNDRDLSSGMLPIAWNHAEFEVQYRCLADEIKIGDYYLRLLLEEGPEAKPDKDSPISKPCEFFNELYHRFLLTPKTEMKCLCLQAMTVVYGRHEVDIGPFTDTRYIVGMLERSCDRVERDCLLLFLNKLIVNRRNVKDFIDTNGLRIVVDLLTLAHLHTSRAVVPTQSNVIEAGDGMSRDSEKEWYYGNAEKERKGPVGFDEMKKLWDDGVLTMKSRCWAHGMDSWKVLHLIPQLKWTLAAKSNALMDESKMATRILNMLIDICSFYPSRDTDGAIIRPLPRAKNILSEAMCQSHIVQLLLTFDPVLVERVATLMLEVMQDNPNVSRLYMSGLFYFILMYTGGNVLPIARLLFMTHTKQSFHSEETDPTEIMTRSILGQLLPDAMVSYLENHGADKFAEIFLGEFDTPEAIWSNEMRRMMIEKIALHICDFSPRLQSNTRALYQYCAIPHINYPQLENELFCGIYYLRHLCDTDRFPDWPIRDPVNLLKKILLAWLQEVEKKPPAMSIDDAYAVLGLPKGMAHEDAVVRKSYFKLAQKFHPDKNPEGRDMFERVNKAYEFLCSRLSRATEGPDPQRIVLILKAQSIVFGRHKDDLQPYKYAGYPMLIKTIQMETADERLFSKSAHLLGASAELAYHTVNCSALNAEELRRENGLESLLAAYSRCVSVLSQSSVHEDVAVQVCMHITRCYTVAAQFQQCRDRMLEMNDLVRDICRILYFKHLTRLCAVSTSCVSAVAVDNLLQMQLIQAGVLWPLLLSLFKYDFTLEEGGVSKSQETNQQEVCNELAKLAIVALARLSGVDNQTPKNAVVLSSLDSLLTPYITRQMAKCQPPEVLKLLNSNTENPYLLWNNGTRAELIEYLENQQQSKVRTGEQDPTYGAEFMFSQHQKEVVLGGVFIRIYNQQPSFVLEDPRGFASSLLDSVGSHAQYLHSLMQLGVGASTSTVGGQERKREVEMALEALGNVVRGNPTVETSCVGHFKLLFCMLRVDGCPRIQQLALEVIGAVTGSLECVEDIANANILVYLLLVTHSLVEHRPMALSTLHAIFSHTKLVKECIGRGGIIHLLDLFCNSSNGPVREKTAELLAKMAGDKLVGPRVRLLLGKFLPFVFLDAMRENPEASVHMFEGVHENPELIWNDEARGKVKDTIRGMKDDLCLSQRLNPDYTWNINDDYSIGPVVGGEVVVGGVYLRLFVLNPSWGLRAPKEFLTELLNTTVSLLDKDDTETDTFDLVTSGLVCLLQNQPTLCDNVPALGHLPRLLKAMGTTKEGGARACILIIHQMANSQVCIDAMCDNASIAPLQKAMKMRQDVVGVACEALHTIFNHQKDKLIKQALDCQLVPYLLSLLDGALEAVKNPSSTKAQIVKALKAMTLSLALGREVTALLDQSTVWAQYRDQKHDLFITNTTHAGYLTGSTPTVAGYLTQGQTKPMPNAPPPMDPEDT